MPVIKGRKELGTRQGVMPVAIAREINSKVKDSMDTGTPNRQGKGVPLKGRQPKTGYTKKTRDLSATRNSLERAFDSAKKTKF